ncbi:G patch domain-containing protein 4-like isoform X1 [Amphibalanus amphitrite]|uniref:G patch domain-containing protein 4-like isoform X1 n=1 Tax=Amphibalanus amphitrite TaxID=1232801 RepID=UPI001C919290|nr:G patch domain-containing protein 4-like isoform X1 [Amphibalanus amphitrite]XP_043194554.1 G patch domain-containing protein 4-like isoform X1 [Amphibalanus amphitrite]XP_043194555.1 G patch domain-containing protein 4-like isoform X1 [Amphibalanus amphitrite]XP_043194556.1 G patch domain-containing protein 4-like isoform X1 [Amphibalanus amphitrite]XP_043194557.1 G patch domain-containing protein 4-like isoform X1 [Amphibalanus amphitrite]XP_043194558.1 G patch domain-containing protein 4
MDFAREHLKQLGWQEGDGLGKGRNGIAEALKPKLKFDTTGIGHDPAKEFTHTWWSEAYNTAAANVTVNEASDGCQLATSNTKKKKKKKVVKSAYSNFVTGGTLVGSSVTGGGEADGEGPEEAAPVESRLSDEQLLAACGGRTAHKGARHGHKMDGKLARIVAQEAAILARLTGQKPADEDVTKRKKKKRKADVGEDPTSAILDNDDLGSAVVGCLKSEKKKKKRKKPDLDAVDESIAEDGSTVVSTSERRKKKKQKSQASS